MTLYQWTHMTTNLLLMARNLKVLVSNSEMSPHLLERLVGDGVDAELLLALGEVEP